jgi:exopolysaccharide biosynthesis protein
VCDGYSPSNAGLTFVELAKLMHELGATDAINLDGGGSATLISDFKIINKPRTRDIAYPKGRAIYSAIVFDPVL